MPIKRLFWICLIVGILALSVSCVHGRGVKFDPPERPEFPLAEWSIVEDPEETLYCTDEPGASALLLKEVMRDSYEEQLEIILEGCNEALGN